MRVMDSSDEAEYARFESLARRLVNTPKPKPSAEDLPSPVGSAGDPAEERPEREEPGGHDH